VRLLRILLRTFLDVVNQLVSSLGNAKKFDFVNMLEIYAEKYNFSFS
jgi:hypothetical protein